MDPKLVKKTQDTLGKIIKKPPLTDKLLGKPPFRFLHDIMTSVIKTAGFMQGLYTDAEMNSENVKDKDAKIAFLQKAIDMVSAVTGQELGVRPVKIVAGHEPEKTNEFLQALAAAINKNVDNDKYVKKVLEKGDRGGGSAKGEKREERKEKEGSTEKKKSRDHEEKDKHDREEKKERSRDKADREGDKKHDRDRHDRDKEKERDRHKDRDRDSKSRDSKSRDKSREERHKDRDRERSKEEKVEASQKAIKGQKEEHGSGQAKLHNESSVNESDSGKLAQAQSRPPPSTKPTPGSKTSLQQGKQGAVNETGTHGSLESVVEESVGLAKPVSGPKGISRRFVRDPQQGDRNNLCPIEDTDDGGETGSSLRQRTDGHSEGIDSAYSSLTVPHVRHSPGGDNENLKQTCRSSVTASERGSGTRMELGTGDHGILPPDREQSREKENESPDRDKVNGEKEEKHEPPSRLQRPSSAKGSRRRREGEENGEEEGDGMEEGEDEEFQKTASHEPMMGEGDLPPQVAAARQLARPSSARPAPPRPKQEAHESEPAMRLGTGQPTNLIVDDDNEDEDENFLVEESAPPPPEPDPTPLKPPDEDDAEHGALVKKMLESKKELEGGSQAGPAKKTEIERPLMSDAQRRKQRELVQKEIEKLRASIQSLTRSANPLGKVMDYVQEDMDSMQQELDKWRSENAQHALDLKREMSVTDRAIDPLRQQLAELDRAIGDQLDRIAALKANTIKNDQKIHKMLHGISSS